MENLDKSLINESPMLERKFWKLISEEPAFVRVLSEKDQADIEWYKKLDESAEVQKWMIGENMTEEMIKELIATSPRESLLYAVSGEKGGDEIEGWIQMWPEEKEKAERIREKFSADLPKDNLVLELSYARHQEPGMPEEKREKGLISSGLRQICYSLGLALTEEDIETKKSKRPLLKPKLSIVGFTDPENKPSEKVLEKSGFKIVGKIKYEPDNEKEDNFWVLDWKKLGDFYAEKDEARI